MVESEDGKDGRDEQQRGPAGRHVEQVNCSSGETEAAKEEHR